MEIGPGTRTDSTGYGKNQSHRRTKSKTAMQTSTDWEKERPWPRAKATQTMGKGTATHGTHGKAKVKEKTKGKTRATTTGMDGRGKGKGKYDAGKGKGQEAWKPVYDEHGKKKCFTCGSDEHLAWQCPKKEHQHGKDGLQKQVEALTSALADKGFSLGALTNEGANTPTDITLGDFHGPQA